MNTVYFEIILYHYEYILVLSNSDGTPVYQKSFPTLDAAEAELARLHDVYYCVPVI